MWCEVLLAMSWAEAAESHVISQQLQIDSIDEAEAVRSQSPNPESISETSLQPELFWVAPLKRFIDSHAPGGLGRQVQILSGCSGTLAEASVFEDIGFKMLSPSLCCLGSKILK